MVEVAEVVEEQRLEAVWARHVVRMRDGDASARRCSLIAVVQRTHAELGFAAGTTTEADCTRTKTMREAGCCWRRKRGGSTVKDLRLLYRKLWHSLACRREPL